MEFIATVLFYCTIGALDSMTMRYSRRVIVCSLIVIGFLTDFLLVRFGRKFDNFYADEVIEWWLIATTPQEIYINGKLQMLLFLGKATFAYARGSPFSCIKADYVVPGRQVRLEQAVDRIVRQMSARTTSSSLGRNKSGRVSCDNADGFTPCLLDSTAPRQGGIFTPKPSNQLGGVSDRAVFVGSRLSDLQEDAVPSEADTESHTLACSRSEVVDQDLQPGSRQESHDELDVPLERDIPDSRQMNICNGLDIVQEANL
jgi:hypothetical protein